MTDHPALRTLSFARSCGFKGAPYFAVGAQQHCYEITRMHASGKPGAWSLAEEVPAHLAGDLGTRRFLGTFRLLREAKAHAQAVLTAHLLR